ncbi:hypothetical protein FDG2_1565 [Candidatus Protofrankia californiensis]|uniref:Uncharacterized protein n=1 Tax=Candidatus Protofrankia californiensis TaxID=1839754 RepID=A0A1C3NVX2_9ACTN|nr:hypothetical protein FDG2_1565 [Candidatus Protofrankia californiensis]
MTTTMVVGPVARVCASVWGRSPTHAYREAEVLAGSVALAASQLTASQVMSVASVTLLAPRAIPAGTRCNPLRVRTPKGFVKTVAKLGTVR